MLVLLTYEWVDGVIFKADYWTECWGKKIIDGLITNTLNIFMLKLKSVTGEILWEGNHEMFRKELEET